MKSDYYHHHDVAKVYYDDYYTTYIIIDHSKFSTLTVKGILLEVVTEN